MANTTGPTVVPTNNVIHANDSSRWHVTRMADVLQHQGQIEPLQVQVYAPGIFITFHDDVHGNDIVQAARQLGWPSLLVVVMGRLES